MDLTPLVPGGRQIVESYGEGRFRVSGQIYDGSVLIFPQRTILWGVTGAAGASLENLEPIVVAGQQGAVELLLFGQGRSAQLVNSALRQDLKAAGVVLEAMDTGAACRTYNVLMAEGRRVAAALIAIS
jgi:uncharacterized protein